MPAAYTAREELANSLTHGLGAVLSVAGLVLLVVFAARHGDAWHVVSTAIFGTTLVLLYTASTLYHSLRGERLEAAPAEIRPRRHFPAHRGHLHALRAGAIARSVGLEPLRYRLGPSRSWAWP
jgi:hypothetical protein